MLRPHGFGHLSVGVVGALVVLVLVGCGGGGSEEAGRAPASSSTPTTPGSSTAGARPPLDVVEGSFDVGGHSLFMRCEGTGSPTVVYLHGSISDGNFIPHNSASSFAQLLASEHRTCIYDRRNVGDSDTVDAVQLPQDALRDLHRLLDAAGIDAPYVLVGASFGGMLAYLYANEHPDDVVGMVLLDSMFPDELALEHLFPPEDTYESYSEADEASLERISHFKTLMAGQRFIGREPAIPVTYLASDTEGFEDNDFGIPAYDRRILELQSAYVDRFSPGLLKRVEAPHYMEPVIPDQIAAEVLTVINEAGLP